MFMQGDCHDLKGYMAYSCIEIATVGSKDSVTYRT